mgnify:CR=1 FL=1
MDAVRLDKSRQFEVWLNAAEKCIDYIVEATKTWDQTPAYIRHGRLTYFNELPKYLRSARFAEQQGYFTKRQIRRLRNLERLAEHALGTLKILRERDEAMLRWERGDGHE